MPWREAVIVSLIVVRGVLLAVTVSRVPEDPSGHYVASDALRYTEIGTAPGTAYRDFPVEVPPVEYAELRLVATDDPRETVVRNAWLQFLLDIAVAGALILGWGRSAALAYLLIGLPLAPFLGFRLDLLSVALAVLGVALVRKRLNAPGGAVLAVAVLTKFWPVTLATLLPRRGRWGALAWTTGAAAAGLLAWALWAGLDGPMQVATFRGATGWQLESTPGTLLLAGTDLPVIFEAGANRIGTVTLLGRLALELALIAALVLIALRVRSRTDDVDGLAALAAVGALLVFAPILSWQYVAWLLPWMGVIAVERRWVTVALSGAVVGLTAALLFQGVPLTERGPPAVGLLVARNIALTATVAAAIAGLLRRPRSAVRDSD